ncbi:MAG: hypothetical protein FWD68_03130 [Alphaproteobacteria bacterium]|nr:hypothetical protein [Alphaproteobacteria bacterium]
MRIALAVVVIAALQGTVALADSAVPVGMFEVIRTHRGTDIDGKPPGDPENALKMTNRIIAFEHNGATFDGDTVVCHKIEGRSESIAVSDVMRRAFGNSSADHSKIELGRTPVATRVPATVLRCLDADESGWTGLVIFTLADGKFALTWDRDYLLILRRLAPEEPIRASFDCSKAASPTERVICADRNLAGWDRSISDGYERLDPGMRVGADQRTWFARREGCGSNKTCIRWEMWLRADDIFR